MANKIKLTLSEDKKYIVSSHGYKLLLEDAILIYDLAVKQKQLNRNVVFDSNNQIIGGFHLKSINRHGSVTIGITTLKFSEMKRLYTKLTKQNIIPLIKK